MHLHGNKTIGPVHVIIPCKYQRCRQCKDDILSSQLIFEVHTKQFSLHSNVYTLWTTLLMLGVSTTQCIQRYINKRTSPVRCQPEKCGHVLGVWGTIMDLWVYSHFQHYKEEPGLEKMVQIYFFQGASSPRRLNSEAHSGILHVQALSPGII